MNITNAHQALAALQLAQAGIDAAPGNLNVIPAVLELITAVTDFGYNMDPEGSQRPRAPSLDDEDQPLYISGPYLAVSALLLVEAGLQKAQQLPGVLPTTRIVLDAVRDYFAALTTQPAPDPAPPEA